MTKWIKSLVSDIISPKTIVTLLIGVLVAIGSNKLWDVVSYRSVPIDVKAKNIGNLLNVSVPRKYSDGIKITYHDNEIENAYISEFTFINKSNYAITFDKYHFPITIDTLYRGILVAFAINCSNSYIEEDINKNIVIADYQVILPSTTLNPEDSFTIIVITNSELTYPKVHYGIIDYPEYTYDELGNDNLFSLMILIAIPIVLGIVAIILVVYHEKKAIRIMKERYSIVIPKNGVDVSAVKKLLESREVLISKDAISDDEKAVLLKEYGESLIRQLTEYRQRKPKKKRKDI